MLQKRLTAFFARSHRMFSKIFVPCCFSAVRFFPLAVKQNSYGRTEGKNNKTDKKTAKFVLAAKPLPLYPCNRKAKSNMRNSSVGYTQNILTPEKMLHSFVFVSEVSQRVSGNSQKSAANTQRVAENSQKLSALTQHFLERPQTLAEVSQNPVELTQLFSESSQKTSEITQTLYSYSFRICKPFF